MSVTLGMNAVLERKEAMAFAAVPLVIDCTLNMEVQLSDGTTRGSNGFQTEFATIIAANASFNMLADDEDADFTAIRTAFFARTPLEFRVLNKTGGEGLHAMFIVSKFTRNEQLREVQKYDIELRPTYDSSLAPNWVTNAA